jgi:putative transposase
MISTVKDKTGSGIRKICDVLDVPRSSFYYVAQMTPTQVSDRELGDLIEEIFRTHRSRYGYRRIASELTARGEVCAPARIRRIMRERNLKAIQPKRYRPQTSDGRADKPSDNLIAKEGLPTAPDQTWAGDITHIRTSRGWLYLAVVIDLFTRRIVGWALADNMRATLVVSALNNALDSRPKISNRIFHSDRGSQYGSRLFRSLLIAERMRQSMSAKANPYDNAWSESVIGTIKRELIGDGCFEDEADAKAAIFEYIDGYYNTERRHSSLGYQSPMAFERELLTIQH